MLKAKDSSCRASRDQDQEDLLSDPQRQDEHEAGELYQVPTPEQRELRDMIQRLLDTGAIKEIVVMQEEVFVGFYRKRTSKWRAFLRRIFGAGSPYPRADLDLKSSRSWRLGLEETNLCCQTVENPIFEWPLTAKSSGRPFFWHITIQAVGLES